MTTEPRRFARALRSNQTSAEDALWQQLRGRRLAGTKWRRQVTLGQNKIGEKAIKLGIDDFVCQFNFYEYYPRKSNARANSMDVYAYIRHLLKVENTEFTKNHLNEKAGTGSSTQNYVTAMENMGLIERSGSVSGSATFKIRDPKIVHAIANSLEIARSN